MERVLKISVVAICILLLVTNCKTSQGTSKKCDGKKGQKTPMGLI